MDVDLVADIRPDHISELASAVDGEFYIDSEMIQDAIKHNSSFNLIHLETMFKVDVFLLKQRPFDLNQMEHRISQGLGNEPEDRAYFSSAEDIILAKMEWYRDGGETSERQWRDILGVLDLQGNRLDYQYLQKWAAQLGLQDLFSKAFETQKHR
jgi:hypothetical protein